MAGHGGGAWKVAYADFVTAMMAFFLVMWITAQSKPVKQAVAEYFEDPLGVNRGSRSTTLKGPEDSTTIGAYKSGRGPARGLAMADNKASGNKNPQGTSAKKPARMMIHRHLDRTRSVGTVIPFPDDSAELNDLGREQLDSVIPQLLGKLNKVEVRVYTPRRPLAAGTPFSDTWALGFARCLATMHYLSEHGIDAERLRLSQDGEFEPLPAQGEASPEDLSSGVEVFAIDAYVNK